MSNILEKLEEVVHGALSFGSEPTNQNKDILTNQASELIERIQELERKAELYDFLTTKMACGHERFYLIEEDGLGPSFCGQCHSLENLQTILDLQEKVRELGGTIDD